MESREQSGDVAQRRREQNRLAQRRFRWKQSQQKAIIREQERQQQQPEQHLKAKKSHVHQLENDTDPPTPLTAAPPRQHRALISRTTTSPTYRPEPFNLPTPASSSSNGIRDPFLSPDLLHQSTIVDDDINNSNDLISHHPSAHRARTNSITSTTGGSTSRTERARSMASGMGGLLGNYGSAAWDFDDIGMFSPPPAPPPPLSPHHFPTSDSHPGDGYMMPSVMFPTAEHALDDAVSFPDLPTTTTPVRSTFRTTPSYPDRLESSSSNLQLRSPILSDGSSTFWEGSPSEQHQQVTLTPFETGTKGRNSRRRRRTPDSTPPAAQQSHTRRTESYKSISSKYSPRQKQNSYHTFLDTTNHDADAGGPDTPERADDYYDENHLDNEDENGWLDPLHLAASKGNDRIVRMLLHRNHQVSVDGPDSNGQTALIHAVRGGFEDVVRTLLDAGAAIDNSVRDRHGRTALHWAVLKRRRTILRHLLERRRNSDARMMNVDVYDDEGHTPLHRAIDSGFEAGVEMLLEYGANLTRRVRGRAVSRCLSRTDHTLFQT